MQVVHLKNMTSHNKHPIPMGCDCEAPGSAGLQCPFTPFSAGDFDHKVGQSDLVFLYAIEVR